MSKIKSIEEYGRRYVRDYLSDQIANRDDYLNDWYNALNFFFSKSFMRGRRDELSERFWKATMRTLRAERLESKYDRVELENKLYANGVNNRRDRSMVLGAIDFAFGPLAKHANNIVQYAVEEVRTGRIKGAFERLDSIYAIGEKLASFFLRDVILTYQLEELLKDDDYNFCQPIDTWVLQTGKKIGVVSDVNTSNNEARDGIIHACREEGVSPLLFNAGAWLVGARSFDMLIERL